MKTFQIKRTVQCAKCPWKKSTNPHDIPDGYSVEQHKALAATIAPPGELYDGPIRAMACHESPPGDAAHCVGWLVNQLGVGNNIPLRLSVMSMGHRPKLRVIGEQHERFEDTLPTT